MTEITYLFVDGGYLKSVVKDLFVPSLVTATTWTTRL